MLTKGAAMQRAFSHLVVTDFFFFLLMEDISQVLVTVVNLIN